MLNDRSLLVLLAGLLSAAGGMPLHAAAPTAYETLLQQDQPVAWWRFDGASRGEVRDLAKREAGPALTGAAVGAVTLGEPGPRPGRYLDFGKQNAAAAFSGSRGFIRVPDPGDESPLDFALGDEITLEAWVLVHALGEGKNVYVVGKGRTNNEGFPRENQNYALRLRGIAGTARLSFLFRNGAAADADYHRWNSDTGFEAGAWRHIAVSYRFGEPDSIRGYINGKPVKGTWDMAGPTRDGPVVDNDELWIGSALGGSAGNTFNGLIDEVALHRRLLSPDQIGKRFRIDPAQPAFPPIEPPQPPAGRVLVELFEGVPAGNPFRPTTPPAVVYTTDSLALTELPKKYNHKGLLVDWKQPLLVRAVTEVQLPPGEQQLLLRSKDQAELIVGGRKIAQTRPMSRNASGHERVPELAAPDHGDLAPLDAMLQEQRANYKSDGRTQTVVLQTIVGANNLRTEIGALLAAVGKPGELASVISPESPWSLTESDFAAHAAAQAAEVHAFNRRRREAAGEPEREYWEERHALARRLAAKRPAVVPPPAPEGAAIHNEIDQFIAAKLAEQGVAAAPLTEDWEFLRRVTLDTVGVIPTPAEIDAFDRDKSGRRRQNVIDRLLDDPRWADHWIGYWQDVLAENPNILKGKLNNTGPFRFWIYESFLDNKPADRFATELIMMEGSKWYGGPAGFSIATQNDAPMAAKAHVIGKAFLGVEMQCARCHDAPYHDVTQEDTFSLAAMLQRGSHKVPKTSVVPTVEGARPPEVTVALKPGQAVSPKWPFSDLAPAELPPQVIRSSTDQREQLAAIITSPRNRRFAEVTVNRLWARYLGRGLVDPVDDWEGQTPSHPELLDWLARQLTAHDYDLKHIARLIFTSHAYQRRTPPDAAREQRAAFACPTRRRMSAEQLVDSLFTAAGKPLGSEPLSQDPEGRRPVDAFLNLGVPQRAWEFASLSNERDRPALALPVAQSIVDMLTTFGWRESRPDPLTQREQEPTVLQPAVLANGLVGRRIVGLSDDSRWTALALAADSPSRLVDDLFAAALSRRPTVDERSLLVELLTPGFDQRKLNPSAERPRRKVRRNAVSWSNHLSPEATRIKLELERAAREGDPPTQRLDADWRQRMEDAVWAVINTPEFVFIP